MAIHFKLGQVVSTPGALEALRDANANVSVLLYRHQSGDWGDVSKEDAKANDLAVKDGSRIFSSYTLKTGVKVWIITEDDRSATTFLVPEDY